MHFAEQVYALVRRVPRGRIVSYGGVAALLGRPRAARAVGRALFELPDGHTIPWWRVVNRNGEISIKGVLHGPAVQRALLEKEGVAFDPAGRIDWKRFGWSADDLPRTADGSVDLAVPLPADPGQRRHGGRSGRQRPGGGGLRK